MPTCEAYCTQIQADCTGANLQFTDHAACLRSCAVYPTDPADLGNTLACRNRFLNNAGAPQDIRCDLGGPATPQPTYYCEDPCQHLCDLHEAACANDRVWTDRAACVAACAQIPHGGTTVDTSGDSVSCRVYHLNVAATDALNATAHCAHAAVPSAVCTGPIPGGGSSGGSSSGPTP